MTFDSICCEHGNSRKLINVEGKKLTYDSYVMAAIKDFGLAKKPFVFKDASNNCIIGPDMFLKYRKRFENTLVLRIEEDLQGLQRHFFFVRLFSSIVQFFFLI